MVNTEPEIAGIQLRVSQEIRDGVHRQDNQVAPLALVEQVLAGVASGKVDDQRGDDVVVRRPVLVAAPVGLVQDLLVACDLIDPLGQSVPLTRE